MNGFEINWFCPKCESAETWLDEVVSECIVATPLLGFNGGEQDLSPDYDDCPETTRYGLNPHYECHNCGYQPCDAEGRPIGSLEVLFQWLKSKNMLVTD